MAKQHTKVHSFDFDFHDAVITKVNFESPLEFKLILKVYVEEGISGHYKSGYELRFGGVQNLDEVVRFFADKSQEKLAIAWLRYDKTQASKMGDLHFELSLWQTDALLQWHCSSLSTSGPLPPPPVGGTKKRIAYYQQQLEIARQADDLFIENHILENLVALYEEQGDLQKAFDCLERQLVIIREFGDHKEEAWILWILGCKYEQKGDLLRAFELMQTYEELMLGRNWVWEEDDYYSYPSRIKAIQRRIEGKLRNQAKHELAIAHKNRDRHAEGTALGHLGSAYAELDEYKLAINYYEQQLIIAREIGDPQGIRSALENLGSAYTNLGDPQKASEYYEQVQGAARESGDPTRNL